MKIFKEILATSYQLLATIKELFDPSLEGNPYEKELPEEKPFFIFGQNLKMRLTIKD